MPLADFTPEQFEEIAKKNKQKQQPIINDAINTIIIGCRIAQEKGAYTLEEARTIMNAIDFLNLDEEK